MSNDDDPTFSELRDNLWYLLACRCEYCGQELDLTDIERIKERDVVAWSRVAAERALAQGWLPVPGAIAAICAGCRVKQN
jgi:hypothetical protein